MAAMILCVLVMLALCVLKLVKRTDYRRESDYFYENNLDEYGENEAYTSEYISIYNTSIECKHAFLRTIRIYISVCMSYNHFTKQFTVCQGIVQVRDIPFYTDFGK